jgi:hypothetical protein
MGWYGRAARHAKKKMLGRIVLIGVIVLLAERWAARLAFLNILAGS